MNDGAEIFHAIHNGPPLVGAFLDQATGCQEEEYLRNHNVLSFELVLEEKWRPWSGRGNTKEWMLLLRKCVKSFKEKMFLFENHCRTELFKIRFYFFDYL